MSHIIVCDSVPLSLKYISTHRLFLILYLPPANVPCGNNSSPTLRMQVHQKFDQVQGIIETNGSPSTKKQNLVDSTCLCVSTLIGKQARLSLSLQVSNHSTIMNSCTWSLVIHVSILIKNQIRYACEASNVDRTMRGHSLSTERRPHFHTKNSDPVCV